MLYLGHNLTQNPPEQLQAITEQELVQLIGQPSGKLLSELEALRKIRQIDEKIYRKRKTFLPYFIGSRFRENIRHSSRFEALAYFVIDLDKCGRAFGLEALKAQLFEDENVKLIFLSPGGDGLKVLFQLESPIVHTKAFADCYKAFALQFADKFGLRDYVDTVTCDVTRVCFLSADPALRYRPDALPVSWKGYAQLATYEKLPWEEQDEQTGGENPTPPLVPEIPYKQILQKLNPKHHSRPKNYYVPPELDAITEGVYARLAPYGISVSQVRDIQYGRQWTFVAGHQSAELNIFYGKNGFSVVKTTKSGTDPELCEAVYRVLCAMLFDSAD